MTDSTTQFINAFIAQERLPQEYFDTVNQYYTLLVQRICSLARHLNHVPIVGINGAQGTGKSTLSACVAGLLKRQGLRALVLSIDDLYHTRARREQLGNTIHPLLKTRGVPGTHDMLLGQRVIDMAQRKKDAPRIPVPRFDKSADNRFAAGAPFPEDGIDVLLFEGWCIGASPQPDERLKMPCNELERQHDKNGVWRKYVNDALMGGYADVFAQVDYLIMLKPPSFDVVYHWRGEQEKKLRQKLKAENIHNSRVMDEKELAFFISHFERLTRWMLEEMPSRADEVYQIGTDHRVDDWIQNSHPPPPD